jgi:hypothetical protein
VSEQEGVLLCEETALARRRGSSGGTATAPAGAAADIDLGPRGRDGGRATARNLDLGAGGLDAHAAAGLARIAAGDWDATLREAEVVR